LLLAKTKIVLSADKNKHLLRKYKSVTRFRTTPVVSILPYLLTNQTNEVQGFNKHT